MNKPEKSELTAARAATRAELADEIEGFHADHLELQTRILQGDLIPRSVVSAVFGKIFAVYRNQINDIGESNGSTVSAVVGTDQCHKVRKILTDVAYQAVGGIIKTVKSFIKGGG